MTIGAGYDEMTNIAGNGDMPTDATSHLGAQWLSGRVLDSRPRGRGFEPHRRHYVVSLSKNINPSLVLVQPRKTRPFITERLLMGRKESNQTNKNKAASHLCLHCLHMFYLWRRQNGLNIPFLGTDVSPFPNFNNSVLTTRRNLLLHC